MRYSHEFVIPPGLTRDNAHTETMYLSYGKIDRITITFRAGCHNVVFVTISDGLTQIVPISPNGYVYGDDTIIEFDMSYEVLSKPYAVILSGWSELCEYEHTITITIDVDTEYEDQSGSLLSKLLDLGS